MTPKQIEKVENWLAALRSGKYKQGKIMLYDRNNDTYCCLGILCRTNNLPMKKNSSRETDFVFPNTKMLCGMPDSTWFEETTGFPFTFAEKLARCNDDESMPFKNIADVIGIEMLARSVPKNENS